MHMKGIMKRIWSIWTIFAHQPCWKCSRSWNDIQWKIMITYSNRICLRSASKMVSKNEVREWSNDQCRYVLMIQIYSLISSYSAREKCIFAYYHIIFVIRLVQLYYSSIKNYVGIKFLCYKSCISSVYRRKWQNPFR